MNTSQIQCCIECDPTLRPSVIGVFAADQLPKALTKYPCGFIANTDIYSKPGEHWCAFYVEKPGVVEFFDSYGHTGGYYNDNFKLWISRHGDKVTFNIKKIQGDHSSVCGLYCLYYLHQRLAGHTLNDIVHSFSSNLTLNDHYIYDTMIRVYATCMQNVCKYNQSCSPLIKM